MNELKYLHRFEPGRANLAEGGFVSNRLGMQ